MVVVEATVEAGMEVAKYPEGENEEVVDSATAGGSEEAVLAEETVVDCVVAGLAAVGLAVAGWVAEAAADWAVAGWVAEAEMEAPDLETAQRADTGTCTPCAASASLQPAPPWRGTRCRT